MKKIIIDSSASGQRIDRYLQKLYVSTSKNTIQKWLRKKLIKVSSKKVDASYRLLESDEIKIFLPDSLLEDNKKKKITRVSSNVNLDIFYEDNDILIVNKPVGMLTHPASGEYKNALSTKVQSYLYESITPTFSPSSIQRLDFNTSGLVIFCKNYTSLKYYNELMRERKIRKFYLAVVEGRIDKVISIDAYLVKDEKNNTVKLSNEYKKGSKHIKSVIKPIEYSDKFSKVEVEIFTGRSHQIRASLSYIGHPIVGDKKYGARYNKYIKHQSLISYKLMVEDRVFELKKYDDLWLKLRG